jgi:hypothetical protein
MGTHSRMAIVAERESECKQPERVFIYNNNPKGFTYMRV